VADDTRSWVEQVCDGNPNEPVVPPEVASESSDKPHRQQEAVVVAAPSWRPSSAFMEACARQETSGDGPGAAESEVSYWSAARAASSTTVPDEEVGRGGKRSIAIHGAQQRLSGCSH
jgi:hypothetical protein